MINCQSWDNDTIELATDRVNVLKAPNNAGKSVLFKMLKITADPKAYTASQRSELIRWGTGGAAIVFTFTDGSTGYTQVKPTGVSYCYNGNMYATPPAEYLEKIGLLTNNGMIANLMDAVQDLLLVNPALRANYDLMQLLVHNDNLESIRENTENNLKTYNIKSDTLNMVSGILEKQLTQYQYIDIEKRSRELETGELCYHIMYDVLLPIIKETSKLAVGLSQDFKLLQRVFDVLETMSGINFNALDVKHFDQGLWELFNAAEKIGSLQFADVETPKFDEDLLKIFDVLQSVKGMDFASIYTEEPMDYTDLYHVLTDIADLKLTDVVYMDGIQAQIASLKKELQDRQAVQECPIYGRVIYDGEECKPYGGTEV